MLALVVHSVLLVHADVLWEVGLAKQIERSIETALYLGVEWVFTKESIAGWKSHVYRPEALKA